MKAFRSIVSARNILTRVLLGKKAIAPAGQILQDIDGELLLRSKPWRLEVTDEFATPLFELKITAKRSIWMAAPSNFQPAREHEDAG